MSSPFGDDSFNIEQELRKLLPETDPLQETPFFSHLAEDLSDARDAASFDAAYESAFNLLGIEPMYMPAHFDRRILVTLCSNPKLLESWARRHDSFVVLGQLGIGAMMRYLAWNRWLWPLELPLYVALFLAFGTGAIKAVLHVDLSEPALMLGTLFILLYFVATIMFLVVFGWSTLVLAGASLLAALVTLWDKWLDKARLKSLEKRRAREAERQAKQAAKA